jgi:hypothetical protein
VRRIKTAVLEVKRDSFVGEPFGTLVRAIAEAWKEIPTECRENSGFEMSALTVWHYRPETEEDRREREEYERLKAKFDKIRYE